MQKKTLAFTEKMAGYFDFFAEPQNLESPKQKGDFLDSQKTQVLQEFEFSVTVDIDDMDLFVNDPNKLASLSGVVLCPKLGHNLVVLKGDFNLFSKSEASQDLKAAKEMHYHLYIQDQKGEPYTMYGFKQIDYHDFFDVWSETTTLYCYLWKGHRPFVFDKPVTELLAIGVLHISIADFMQQLSTFTVTGVSELEKPLILAQFVKEFVGPLYEAYAPSIFGSASRRWNEHYYPIHTQVGVASPIKEIYSVDTPDGLSLLLHRFKKSSWGGSAEPHVKNIILLIHGLTNATDMFIMPEHYNLVNYLHNHGLSEVWSLDWRGSNRYAHNLTPHRYTVDDVAMYDLPAAIDMIKQKMGQSINIHIIAHCVGSMAVSSAIAADLITVKSFIGNSVSYTPQISWQAMVKIVLGPDILEYVFRYPYVSPKIPYFPSFSFGKWIFWFERMIRSECDEPACHMMSFMWGYGFPAFFNHDHLNPITHRRLADLFGGTSFHYYRHIRKMALKKQTVKYSNKGVYSVLPDSYLEAAISHKNLPPMLLSSGSINKIFPGSNWLSFSKLKQYNPERLVEYFEIPNYGHQDPFIGKKSYIDVFPRYFEFLKRNGALDAN